MYFDQRRERQHEPIADLAVAGVPGTSSRGRAHPRRTRGLVWGTARTCGDSSGLERRGTTWGTSAVSVNVQRFAIPVLWGLHRIRSSRVCIPKSGDARSACDIARGRNLRPDTTPGRPLGTAVNFSGAATMTSVSPAMEGRWKDRKDSAMPGGAARGANNVIDLAEWRAASPPRAGSRRRSSPRWTPPRASTRRSSPRVTSCASTLPADPRQEPRPGRAASIDGGVVRDVALAEVVGFEGPPAA